MFCRAEVEPHTVTFDTVASFLPVVLSETDLCLFRPHHRAQQHAFLFHSFIDDEAKSLEETDALWKIVTVKLGESVLT